MTNDPLETVRVFMAAMERLDFDAALVHVSEDVQYTNMPLGAEGTVRGHDGIRAVLEPFFAPTLANEWVIRSAAVAGTTVFIERLDRHQLSGGWAELPVTGVFEVVDGKIAAWRDYFDFATIEKQMAAFT